MFIRFFVCTFFLKSLNFRLVDTLSAQFHSHMDYLIYWRYANSTHLRYSSFARNFEFSSLVICILRSTKSQNFTILLFSNFIYQKSVCVCVWHAPPDTMFRYIFSRRQCIRFTVSSHQRCYSTIGRF